MAAKIVVDKEMAITHADFLRILPRALDGREHTVDGNRIVVADGPRRLEVTLSETTERRIGTAHAVIDRRKRQQPAALSAASRLFGEPAELAGVVIGANLNSC